MKVNTNIKTLKKVYASFKEAGLSGLLTGEEHTVPAAVIMDKLISEGIMEETVKTITGSEVYVSEDGISTAWDEVPYSLLNQVLADFFTGIGSVYQPAQKK